MSRMVDILVGYSPDKPSANVCLNNISEAYTTEQKIMIQIQAVRNSLHVQNTVQTAYIHEIQRSHEFCRLFGEYHMC